MESGDQGVQDSGRLEQLDRLYDAQFEALKRNGESGRSGPFGFRSGTSVVAQGDSWFDYLPGNDIIKALKRRGFAIKNYGTGGDTLENMLFGTEFKERSWERYPAEHEKVLEALRTIRPKFFLFSGGGNDIAGPELAPYLNHMALMPDAPLRVDHLDFMFRKVFRASYEFMINSVSTTLPGVQIILHGYGNAIPTGRGVLKVGPWQFIGPWLRPSLTAKGILDAVVQCGIIQTMIGVLNEMLADLASAYPNVHYLDLRSLIKDQDWENELHLTHKGYEAVGDTYLALMEGLLDTTELEQLAESREFVIQFLDGQGSVPLLLESTIGR